MANYVHAICQNVIINIILKNISYAQSTQELGISDKPRPSTPTKPTNPVDLKFLEP